MAEERDTIVLVMLRRIDAPSERMEHGLHDLESRLTNIEGNVAGSIAGRIGSRKESIGSRSGLA